MLDRDNNVYYPPYGVYIIPPCCRTTSCIFYRIVFITRYKSRIVHTDLSYISRQEKAMPDKTDHLLMSNPERKFLG